MPRAVLNSYYLASAVAGFEGDRAQEANWNLFERGRRL